MRCLLAFVLLVFSPLISFAGDYKVGDNVFLKPEAETTNDGKQVDINTLPVPATIAEIKDEKVRLGNAWVRKSQVMTADTALEFYSSQIRLERKKASVWERRGLVWAEMGRRIDAIKDFNEAIKLDPHNSTALVYRDRVRKRELGGRGEDIVEFDEAIRLDPTNATAYFNRGVAWAGQVMFESEEFKSDGGKTEITAAINDWTEAIRLNPQYKDAYKSRAITMSLKGEFDAAIEDWTDVIRLDSSDAEAYSNRAGILILKGEFDSAIEDWTEAIRLDSTNAEAYSNRADLLEMKGNFEDAINDLTETINLVPKNVAAYSHRATLWQQKGQFENAIKDYDTAIKLNPEYALAYDGLAWLRATCPDDRFRNGGEAVTFATKACELTRWKIHGYFASLAAAFAEAGDFMNAVKWQEKSLEGNNPFATSVATSAKTDDSKNPLKWLLKTDEQEMQNEKKEATERLELYRGNKPYRDIPKK